jgi:hypothetical protein
MQQELGATSTVTPHQRQPLFSNQATAKAHVPPSGVVLYVWVGFLQQLGLPAVARINATACETPAPA